MLSPDLFPCRRYGQFEDALNRVTADPLMGILTTISHLDQQGIHGRLELVVRPAGYRRPAQAKRTLHRLDHPYFRTKPRLSHFYAASALSPHLWRRIVAKVELRTERTVNTAAARGLALSGRVGLTNGVLQEDEENDTDSGRSYNRACRS
jgi:hypothetical protein